jgi:hypothetical protein
VAVLFLNYCGIANPHLLAFRIDSPFPALW